MSLANPFILIIVLFGFITIAYASYMDGVEQPPRKYNFNHTLIAVMINWLLIFGAVIWAVNH
jgi:hypothetical protein